MNTRTHGILDYLVGALLIVAPWLLGFRDNDAATWSAVIVGALTITYSLFTDYELSLSRIIPMGTHLALDYAGGIFLAVSPWLLGFAEYVYLPHLIVGLLEIGVAAMTRRHPVARGVAT